MAISFTRYIDITSGVGATNQVPQRQLIARLFTDNPLLPPQSFIEFNTAAEVGSYFGTSSQEYLRAVYYFSFISKNTTSPALISYARWVDVDQAPMIFGLAGGQALANWTPITSGSIGLTIGGVHNNISGIDFSGDASLTAVAATLQAAIRMETGSEWTAATVTYSATNGGSFIFTAGVAGAATLSVQAGTGGTDISTIVGWLPEATFVNGVFIPGAIVAPGSAVETISQTLTNSAGASTNFGSFAFMPATPLTLTQNIQAAQWNNLPEQNVMYVFSVPVTSANAAAWAATDGTGLGLLGGTCLTLSNTSGQYPEMLPMMIEASTNYSAANSVQNYEFQQSTLTPSVSDDATADAMEALRINYYGVTQTAGQLLAFYQRGVLLGLPVNPLDINTYANESWLKDAVGAAIMNLFLALAEVSASAQGRLQLTTVIQSIINQALNNGTISVGKPLNVTQQLYIGQITGNPKAWYQVQNSGYWLDVEIVQVPNVSPIEYQAVYTLIYSKDDVIRKVIGTHDLI